MNPALIIASDQDLAKLMEESRSCDAVALDTEFVWERTYYPQLGLIQIGLSGEKCYVIDPVAIKDLSPLGTLLADKKVIKILHDAPQDLSILSTATNSVPQNIFDTRLAAGFAGFRATISLSQLIQNLLGTELDKSETRTNWLQRPLTEKQLKYALDDVRYLRTARVALLGQIIDPGIKTWLQEELNQLNNSSSYSPIADHDRYKKIRGINKLNPKQLSIAKNLAIWREQMARELNRPRGHIIKDKIILEIATRPINSQDALKKTSLSEKGYEKYGQQLFQIATNSRKSPLDSDLSQKKHQLTSKEKNTLQHLKDLIAMKCDILNIDPALIGSSSELKKLVKSLHSGQHSNLKQTIGWRKELLKDFFIFHNSQNV